ncbi:MULTISPECIES: GNAT family N-acetyltransferase [Rufibacter]|uniref:GNAT superfamily N-acetyltransferase n=1 Tax=Rufibacter quisquiliarum TaxID=1549639 RepID=A0A839G8X1_9BACT|nr:MULTISPECIES: GNAT family N-acetyltransferase [Rufibacter]MBA9075904.1 GNAT superfamily N-acetyltransferase [Rufibacter quisquiliarum]
MTELLRTDSGSQDFAELVALLDADLHVRDGDDHSFFAQFNKIDMIRHVVVAYQGMVPAGCGAIKPYADTTAEVKRMFVLPEFRGQGIAGRVLRELERWAVELGFEKLILETGKAMPEAIRLYSKNGYTPIPNYGQYKNIESSVCMHKPLQEEKVEHL